MKNRSFYNIESIPDTNLPMNLNPLSSCLNTESTVEKSNTENSNDSINSENQEINQTAQINTNITLNSMTHVSSNLNSDSNQSQDENKTNSKLTFGFWNVEGLYEKLHLSDLCEFIQSLDIIGLGETFTLPGFKFDIKFPDHYALHCPATKYSKYGRPSGGIVLLIRKTLRKFIKIIDTQLSHVLAIRINKKLCKTGKDVLLIMVYNHPRESIFYKNKDYFSTLEQVDQFIANLIEKGQEFDVILGGDLNARIGDWAYTDDGENDEDSPTTYLRESQDSFINNAGRTLIELCTTFGLSSLSGLKIKDFCSKFTFIGHRGSSIVDHIITSIDLLEYVIDFKTIERVESNHVPIVMTVENKTLHGFQEHIKEDSFTRTRWQEKKAVESQNVLNKKAIENLLNNAEEQLESSVDESLDLFNQAMSEVNKPMKQTMKTRNRKTWKNEWFDKECKESKKSAKRSLQKLNRLNRRKNAKLYEKRKEDYLAKKLQYNKLIKEKKKIYKKETQEKLIESKNDSKSFWDLIKKISSKTVKVPNIKLSEWKTYFQNLLNPTGTNNENVVTNPMATVQQEVSIDELDKEITNSEIQQALDKQKNGKASGIDEISPELLKLAKPKILTYLSKLFNTIYTKSYFPKEWATSIIIPIHKKGNKSIMDNYRGISLLCLTSKVFTAILNTRLYNWLEVNNKICTEQAGFRRNYSTTDHIFTLYSMVNNCLYGKKRSKLYVAFIDYKKAFDSINRNKLWEALKETGVSTKMTKMIQAIYKQVKAKVRFGNKLSEELDCFSGVKQGCLLSPALFSILINKVAHKIAEGGRMGYQFINGGKEIFSLLFADDIVLISQTPAGLQNQLNNLKKASEELGLEVNLEKTKTMIFRRGGYIGRTERWHYGREKIETVNSYKYLGYTFTTKLSTEAALSEVAGKAKNKVINIFKALYKIGKIDIKVFFHLFDCQVKPMLLYAAEIWGNTQETITEKVHMFAARKLLGVTAKNPKTMIYGELNRYPLAIDSKMRVLKYWLKLNEMDEERLPKQAYNRAEKELDAEKSWGNNIKELLEKNGYGYVWINKGVMYKNSFLKSFKQRLVDQYWQEWHTKINEKDRYKKYKEFKESHLEEPYLKLITVTKFRRIVTKFRLGIIDIQTNKRYNEIEADTKCPMCKQQNEDEMHILMKCPSYIYLRQKYIHKHWPETEHFTLEQILNTQDEEKLKDLSMFLYYSMRRKEYLLME